MRAAVHSRVGISQEGLLGRLIDGNRISAGQAALAQLMLVPTADPAAGGGGGNSGGGDGAGRAAAGNGQRPRNARGQFELVGEAPSKTTRTAHGKLTQQLSATTESICTKKLQPLIAAAHEQNRSIFVVQLVMMDNGAAKRFAYGTEGTAFGKLQMDPRHIADAVAALLEDPSALQLNFEDFFLKACMNAAVSAAVDAGSASSSGNGK